jgi:hypothetical protein
MKCEICGKELNQNHLRIHGITKKEYYDKYLKKEGEDICKCGKKIKGWTWNTGYIKFCSTKCSARDTANKKIEKYVIINKDKENSKLIKTCKKCGKQFKTFKQNKEYCDSKQCRKYSPTEPKQKEDIKIEFIDNEHKMCPYCGKIFNDISTIFNHLTKHFPIDKLQEVENYLIFDVWKIKDGKCTNLKCDNLITNYQSNFCDICNEQYFGSQFAKIKRTDDEWEELNINRGISISKKMQDKMQTDEGKEQWKKQCESTGKINSIKMTEYFKDDIGKQRKIEMGNKVSITMKQKVLDGSFTPKVRNSRTHFEAQVEINGIIHKFRSSWEACVFLSNSHLKYEKLRMKYINENNENHIYITDFVDYENKVIYEIKPSPHLEEFKYKLIGLQEYCKINNYNYIIITEFNIMKFVKISDFKSDFNKIQLNKMMKSI